MTLLLTSEDDVIILTDAAAATGGDTESSVELRAWNSSSRRCCRRCVRSETSSSSAARSSSSSAFSASRSPRAPLCYFAKETYYLDQVCQFFRLPICGAFVCRFLLHGFLPEILIQFPGKFVTLWTMQMCKWIKVKVMVIKSLYSKNGTSPLSRKPIEDMQRVSNWVSDGRHATLLANSQTMSVFSSYFLIHLPIILFHCTGIFLHAWYLLFVCLLDN